MNALYAVAVLEGYLSQHHPLPPTVQQALEILKEQHQSTTAPGVAPATTTKRKKQKLTKEQREQQLAQLARMRETARRNREERKAVKQAA
jgi:hypothetical protein